MIDNNRYILNELIKTYHIFSSFDAKRGREVLGRINQLRLMLAVQAEQRQVFWKQTPIAANASGYTNDVFVTSDDIRSVVSRFIAYLEQAVQLSLVQQGTREVLFTRQRVAWQQLASCVQSVNLGQHIPFDLPQEIFLEKNHSLNFGVTGQTSDGFIFTHGANLKDDYAPNEAELRQEINTVDENGYPVLPQTVLVPIQFQFTGGNLPAISVNGSGEIYSSKDSRSVLLTEVSCTTPDITVSLTDNGRNQLLCDNVEVQGIAADESNQFTNYYPLPYPHLLRKQDRLQLKALNGSLITGNSAAEDVINTLCFRGFTV